jgi:hypothetical protein
VTAGSTAGATSAMVLEASSKSPMLLVTRRESSSEAPAPAWKVTTSAVCPEVSEAPASPPIDQV